MRFHSAAASAFDDGGMGELALEVFTSFRFSEASERLDAAERAISSSPNSRRASNMVVSRDTHNHNPTFCGNCGQVCETPYCCKCGTKQQSI